MKKLEKETAPITASHGCNLYGFGDLEGHTPGELARFYCGISFVFQIEPWVMDQLSQVPTDGCKAPSFFDSSVALKPNLHTAQ